MRVGCILYLNKNVKYCYLCIKLEYHFVEIYKLLKVQALISINI